MDEAIRLKNREFVCVDGSYGFDQREMANIWSDYYVNRACGVAALANLWCYGSGMFNLTQSEGRAIMKRMIRIAWPRPWGIATPRILCRGIRALKAPFRPEILSGRLTKEVKLAFIRRHLAANRPVALLNTNHLYRAFSYHWVTVTEIFEESEVLKIYFSSWGGRYKLELDTLLSDKTLYCGLVALVPIEEEK